MPLGVKFPMDRHRHDWTWGLHHPEPQPVSWRPGLAPDGGAPASPKEITRGRCEEHTQSLRKDTGSTLNCRVTARRQTTGHLDRKSSEPLKFLAHVPIRKTCPSPAPPPRPQSQSPVYVPLWVTKDIPTMRHSCGFSSQSLLGTVRLIFSLF